MSYFSTPKKIDITVSAGTNGNRDVVLGKVISILNQVAEARFDGQNTKYVNNMQPEIDFNQDRDLVYGYFDSGIANIIKRIEPYVVSYSDGVLSLSFPENWKQSQQTVLETKINEYLVHYIISQWVEKVSVDDVPLYTEKANQLLREIKGVCELRKGAVHRGWDTTY